MNIGQNILNSYDTNIQNRNIQPEHTKGADTVSAADTNLNISGLKEGAVFKGEILDIIGDKVTLALENQNQLQARLQTGVELGVGDILLFGVKENTSSHIMIKPMFDSLYSAQTQVLEKILDAAGLSPTEKNFSAAKELMEAGMPVDKNSLVKILSQSMKFEGTSMQTLVSLNKMDIPVTEENIAQYERYQSYNHQLSEDVQRTTEGMTSFVKAFPEGTSGTTLLSVADRIINIFSMETENRFMINRFMINREMSSGGLTGNGASQAVMNDSLNAGNTSGVQGLEAGNGFVAESENGTKTIGMDADALVSEHADVLKEELSMKDSGFYEQIAGKTGLTKGSIVNLEHMLQKAGVSDQQITVMFRKADSAEDLLKSMTQNLSQLGGSDAVIRNVLDSAEYKKLFSDMIKNHWSINPSQMKDPKEIDELYNKILKQGKAFEQLIALNGGEAKEFNQGFQNMRQNMQFMEQLNHQMIYAQMPLKLSNQTTNSELYVYADKRKLMEKKDGISVMLHLDMDYLGMTDIKVTLTGTNVNARFYLNDQESVNIVADNMGQLANQLEERGFSMTNEVIKRTPQESVNLVVDEIIDENAEQSIKRYTFDART